jgi:hypothetical protein
MAAGARNHPVAIRMELDRQGWAPALAGHKLVTIKSMIHMLILPLMPHSQAADNDI